MHCVLGSDDPTPMGTSFRQELEVAGSLGVDLVEQYRCYTYPYDVFGRIEDVRREDYVPSYAGGASRIDFVLREPGLVIELKAASATLGARQLGEQILVDVGRYKRFPDARHLVCLVFDSGHYVDNPRGLENDLSIITDGLPVTVSVLD